MAARYRENGMAATTLAPEPAPALEDPVTFTEAALMFKETRQPEFSGPVSALKRKLQRWARADGLHVEARPGCDGRISYTDLLEAHARRYPGSAAP